jgi:hypothetical protein
MKIIRIAALLLVLSACFIWFVYRPWAMNWGATDAEIAREMPGDSIIANATFSATRAVTVDAAPEHIWPWLLQFGYRRAGLYSYDALDNDGIASAEHVIPELQNLSLGDSIPIGPGFFVAVQVLDADRVMLLVFPDWAEATWAWGLYPVDEGTTRLVTRLRGRPQGRSIIFAELGEIFPMRKSMLGIKRRAERLARRLAEQQGHPMSRSGPFAISIRENRLCEFLDGAWQFMFHTQLRPCEAEDPPIRFPRHRIAPVEEDSHGQ